MKFHQFNVSDIDAQKRLLLIALWTPEDEPDNSPEVLELPHIKEYFENWGQEGDMGLFAVGANGEAIGIVQLRYKSCLTESYSEYPELAIAVAPAYHGQGIASALMRELLERIDVTVKGIRLGVHPKNTVAMALYKKFGFKVYDTGKNGFPQLVMKVNT